MSTETRAGLQLLVSAALLRLSLSDAFLRYVREGMRPWLVISGVVLGILGVAALVRPARDEAHDEDHDDAGDDHSPWVAWLLVLPVLGIFLVAPNALGSYAAARQDARRVAPRASFPRLPDVVDGAVPLSLNEYTLRTIYDKDESLKGQRVRLLGFVTPDPDGEPGAYVLTRFAIACCAADGVAMKVRVTGSPQVPPTDTWVAVDGDWVPPDRLSDGTVIESRLARVAWRAARVVPEPRNPYE